MTYIIDFDRVNQLTSTMHDDPKGGYGGSFAHSVSRKIIKDYLEYYTNNKDSKRVDGTKMDEIIQTLTYNKILISPADIRNEKINNILDAE